MKVLARSIAGVALVGVLLLAVSGAVQAAKGDITVHTVSTHFGANGMNNINPGIAYNVHDRVRFGALVNSFKLPSAYGAYLLPVTEDIRLGFGLVTGYQFKDGRILGKTNSVIPLFAVEVDVIKNVSVLWFGTAVNVTLKFK